MDEIDENHHSILKQEYMTLKRNLYAELFKVTLLYLVLLLTLSQGEINFFPQIEVF